MAVESLVARDQRDWRGGMIFFGVILVGMGLLSGAMGLLMGAVLVISPAFTNSLPPRQTLSMIPGMVFYLGIGVLFMVLGIGSMKVRRWARSLILIITGFWGFTGLAAMIMIARWMPRYMDSLAVNVNVSAVSLRFAMFVAVILLAVMFGLIPGSLFLFYRSRNVRYTVERHDPTPRWTDACPLPVLGMALLFFSGAFTFLGSFGYRFMVPFFGVMLHGRAGAAVFLVLIGLHIYLGLGMYRLRPAAWMAAVAYVVIMSVSAVITFLRVDIIDIYRDAGILDDMQVNLMRDMFDSRMMLEMTLPWMAGMLIYLFLIKRYFIPGRLNSV